MISTHDTFCPVYLSVLVLTQSRWHEKARGMAFNTGTSCLITSSTQNTCKHLGCFTMHGSFVSLLCLSFCVATYLCSDIHFQTFSQKTSTSLCLSLQTVGATWNISICRAQKKRWASFNRQPFLWRWRNKPSSLSIGIYTGATCWFPQQNRRRSRTVWTERNLLWKRMVYSPVLSTSPCLG